MTVLVRYQTQLRQILGAACETFDLEDNSCVLELLRRIAEGTPHGASLLLDAEGKKRASLLVFVRDQQVQAEHRLCAGDEVTLMTPIAGGAP